MSKTWEQLQAEKLSLYERLVMLLHAADLVRQTGTIPEWNAMLMKMRTKVAAELYHRRHEAPKEDT